MVCLDIFWMDNICWLHRCWWRMLETKCVGDNFEILVTALAVFVTNILYHSTLASGTNVQKMSPISKFCHQHPKIFTDIKSPISTCHQHQCSYICFLRPVFNWFNQRFTWDGFSWSITWLNYSMLWFYTFKKTKMLIWPIYSRKFLLNSCIGRRYPMIYFIKLFNVMI